MTDFDTDVIKPSGNQTEEQARWLPPGARHLLLQVGVDDRLDDQSPAIVSWMQERNLVTVRKQGPDAGHKVLTGLGRKVHKALERRMEGRES